TMIDDEEDRREVRLRSELEGMLALRRPGGLIDFQCAPLGREEAKAWQRSEVPADVVLRGMKEFLSVEEFQRRHPGRAPEKYLVALGCWGVAKVDEVRRMFRTDCPSPGAPQPFTADGLVVYGDHRFEAIFPISYPETSARFVWLTPIFHPN